MECGFREAKELLSAFSDEEEAEYFKDKDGRHEKKPDFIKLPLHTYNFWDKRRYSRQTEKAFIYLYERGFGINEIDEYFLKYCVAGNFKYRIIIPIYFRQQLVNYIGRDYSGKQQRYDNCKRDEAIIRASHLFYGWDRFIKSKSRHCRIVEGAFDCFRMGNTSLGLLKSKLSSVQKSLLKAADIDSCTLFLDRDAHGKAYEIGEELEPFIPAIKVIMMPDSRDVAEHPLEELLKLEEALPFNKY